VRLRRRPGALRAAPAVPRLPVRLAAVLGDERPRLVAPASAGIALTGLFWAVERALA